MPQQPYQPMRNILGTPLKDRAAKLEQSIQPEEKAKHPSTVRSTSELKEGEPKEKESTPKTLRETLNTSNLNTETAKKPSEAKSEYPRISDAEATVVSIFPFVHGSSNLFCVYNKLD